MRRPKKKAKEKTDAKTEPEDHHQQDNQSFESADAAQIKQATIFALFGISGILGMIGAFIWNIDDSFKPASVVFIIAAVVLGLVAIVLQVLAVIRVERPATILAETTKKSSPQEPFTVTVSTVFVGMNRSLGSPFWYSWGPPNRILSPIHVMMMVRITNNQPNRSQIEKYSVDVSTGENKWIRLMWMNAAGRSVYFIPNFKKNAKEAFQILDSPFLDSVLSHRSISPNETVEGWALFEYPEEMGSGPMRINLKDFGGAETSQLIKTSVDTFTQGTSLRFEGMTDMSDCELRFYREPS